MVKSPLENGNGPTAAGATATADGPATADVRIGWPTIVSGPGFGLAELV
jgi:hypothetical protein